LLDAGTLFQKLLTRDLPAETYEVANDLDVDAFDLIPFVTHSALIAQSADGGGLYDVTLTINLFLEPLGAHAHASAVYAVVRGWNRDPELTIVPDVGAIEEVEDLNAIAPVSGEVLMNNKVVRHYQGTFNITARVH
jgi:hypothetical protein